MIGRLRRSLRTALFVLAVLVGAVVTYLTASVAGAVISAAPQTGRAPGESERIYLLTTVLHADFALPVTPEIRSRFAHLAQDGIPLASSNLRYLVFGWGCRAFYTTAGQLTDIRPGPTYTAVTGDVSVIRVVPAGDISGLDNAYPVDLPPGGLARLADFIASGFVGGVSEARRLDGEAYGFGDVFYEARGDFDIFKPCNIWAAAGLRAAGLTTGRWTPTTHALKLGLRLHSPDAVPDPLF